MRAPQEPAWNRRAYRRTTHPQAPDQPFLGWREPIRAPRALHAANLPITVNRCAVR